MLFDFCAAMKMSDEVAESDSRKRGQSEIDFQHEAPKNKTSRRSDPRLVSELLFACLLNCRDGVDDADTLRVRPDYRRSGDRLVEHVACPCTDGARGVVGAASSILRHETLDVV